MIDILRKPGGESESMGAGDVSFTNKVATVRALQRL